MLVMSLPVEVVSASLPVEDAMDYRTVEIDLTRMVVVSTVLH